MAKKTKVKKNIPTDIPIFWVNIIETDSDDAALL
jgi:hypothetical protein